MDSNQKLAQSQQKQIRKEIVAKAIAYQTSPFYKFIRYLKQFLFMVVLIIWITAFIILGIFLGKNKSRVSEQKATIFYFVGIIPILLFIIYIIKQWFFVKTTHNGFLGFMQLIKCR